MFVCGTQNHVLSNTVVVIKYFNRIFETSYQTFDVRVSKRSYLHAL